METLLERGAEGDLAEAQEAIDRLANLPADDGSAMREITLLRLRALLARARGDDAAYRGLAGSLSRDGEIAWLRRTHRVGRGDGRGWAIAGQGMRRGAIDLVGRGCRVAGLRISTPGSGPQAGENHHEPWPSPPDAPSPEELLPVDDEAADDDAAEERAPVAAFSAPAAAVRVVGWSPSSRWDRSAELLAHPERIAHHRPRLRRLAGVLRRLGRRGASRRLGRCRGGRLGSTGWRRRHLLGLRRRVSRRHLMGSVVVPVKVARWVPIAVPVEGHLLGWSPFPSTVACSVSVGVSSTSPGGRCRL